MNPKTKTMYKTILFAFAMLSGVMCHAQSCFGVDIVDPFFVITSGGTYGEGGGEYVVCTSDPVTIINPDSVWADYGTDITIVNPDLSFIFSNGDVTVSGEPELGNYFIGWLLAPENYTEGIWVGSSVEYCPDGLDMLYMNEPSANPCLSVGIATRGLGRGPVVGPNPVVDRLRIVGGDVILGSVLTDTQGREVLRAGANTKELDVSTLAPGQYILSVRTPEGRLAHTVVKE